MGTSSRRSDGSPSTIDPRAVLETVLARPSDQPDLSAARVCRSLVAGLADEHPGVRFSSFWAIRLLAGEQPAALPKLVAYLAVNREASPDVSSALAYLRARYPDHVDPVLSDHDIDPDSIEAGHIAVPGSIPDDSDVVTRRLQDIRHVIDTAGEVPTVIEREMDGSEGPNLPVVYDESRDDSTERAETDAESTRGRTGAQKKRAEIDEIETSALFETIRDQCRFEDLTIVLPRDGHRYADTIRARAHADGEESGVAVRLPDRPDDPTDAYRDAIARNLARWQGACSAAGIVRVHDWAPEPRPWVMTEPVEQPLAEWDPPSMMARLECGIELTETVASCHQQGVVHGGIDPHNVVVPVDELSYHSRPQLDNTALMLTFREHFDPTEYLDVRYMAPEYVDSSYGAIDQATDIYQLGMVLYHLLTGEPPFPDGDDLQDHVLDTELPAPTDTEPSLPDGVDEIIAKATAKQKLVRYETASRLWRELDRVCGDIVC